MIHFSIFGIPVRVAPWFWLTMVLIGGGFSANDSLSIMLVFVFVFAGFISILVHELGHALTIRKYGLPTSITLQAFGGLASYPAGYLDRKQSFLVMAAGPALQFVLGILVLLIAGVLPVPAGSLFTPFLHDLMIISIVWAIFNCLPIYPMDGGQMLAAVLGPRRQHYVHLTSALFAIGIGIAAFLYYRSLFMPVFMGLFAWQNWQAFRAHSRAR